MKPKGNPFKRGETWTFIYYVKDEYGKRKQKWKGGYETKREAEAELKKYKAMAELGQITANSHDKITLEQYLWQWHNQRKQNLSPNTVIAYETNIRAHIIPYIGSVKLADLKSSTIQQLYNTLITKDALKGKTVVFIHAILTTALKAARLNGYIKEDICAKVKPPKTSKYKHHPLSLNQIRELLKCLDGEKYETEIKLAILLGLRRGEVLGLKEEDVDFESHSILIQRQVNITNDRYDADDDSPCYGLRGLKSETSNRLLYMSDEIEEIIKKRIEYNHKQKAMLGDEYHDQGLICCKANGSLIGSDTLYRNFKKILRKYNLPDIRFHDLRHSYATLCIDSGVPLKVISQALGHSSTAITDMVYADSISQKRQLANTLSKIINQSENEDAGEQ